MQHQSAKYVNVTDVISRPPAPRRHDAAATPCPEHLLVLSERLFFAYRDFVADADAILAHHGFGRAHHRVLHFVGRNPGLTVADLLTILGITKQSLGRVLRELIDQGFVTVREGEADRRQRLLFTTPKGSALAGELASVQAQRLQRALDAVSPEGQDAVMRFLAAVADGGRPAPAPSRRS